MSKINYGTSPIGDHFDFMGLDLVIDRVNTFIYPPDMSRRISIDARVANESKKYQTKSNPFGIKRVIFNGPATIVFWNDGTKTVVKCAEEEIYNKRTAIIWAIMKKAYGNSSRANKAFDKLIEDAETTNDNENVSDVSTITEGLVDIKIDTEKLIKDATKGILNSIYGANANRK